MFKNIAILVLIITNVVTLFLYYEQKSELELAIRSENIQKVPAFYYRIILKDGGVAKGTTIVKKPSSIDLIDHGKTTITIENSNIRRIEKVYSSAARPIPKDQ